MNNSEKLLKTLSGLIENGVFASRDIKKEISNNFKFKRDNLINMLQIVSKEEFSVLKKKKTKKAKKS